MHSFLIVSKNRQKAVDYAMGECIKIKIDKFDISVLSFEKAIGIEDIRNFQKQVILKPMNSKIKAVILDGSFGITTEAQNSLLKILEEPPNNTIIYITTENKNVLLPTILSRCKIIELKDNDPELSKDEINQYLNILISLPSSGVGKRLKLAQDIAKNKDEVVLELEKMIIAAREELIDCICHSEERSDEESPDDSKSLMRSFANAQDDNGEVSKYLITLISIQKTYMVLKTTNVNPRLALENLFLNL